MKGLLILALINCCYLAEGADTIKYGLVNGKQPTEGRLEITKNGVTGSVCGGDSFKEDEARVVCKSLGHRYDTDSKATVMCESLPGIQVDTEIIKYDTDSDAAVVCKSLVYSGGETKLRPIPYGEAKGTIWLSKVDCKGDESELADCKHEKWGEKGDCTHKDDVGIECTVTVTQRMYRIGGNYGIGSGTMEFFYKGKWGNICADEVPTDVFNVFCKSIGFKEAIAVDWGRNTQEFVWKNVECAGREDYLHECKFEETDTCRDPLAPEVKCRIPYHNTQSKGLWRFEGGPSPVNGRVEAWDDHIWGSVCDTNFGAVDASILCRSLGFRSGKKSEIKYPGEGLIMYTDIQCGGAESSLNDCSKTTNTSNCTHAQDVAVICDVKNEHVKLRIADGDTKYNGRLEVSLMGEWGTVSSKDFGTPEAQVACQTLGHSGGRALNAVMGNPMFGQGKGKVWMNGVNCTGKEKHLNECKFPGWGIDKTDHGKDVGIQCLPSGPIKGDYTIQYRLVDGPNEHEGRLEVRADMILLGWGTVCNNKFDKKDAEVICRSQRKPGGEVISKVKKGKGPILLDNIACKGTEMSLQECNLIWGSSKCTHDQDVYIKCDNPDYCKDKEKYKSFLDCKRGLGLFKWLSRHRNNPSWLCVIDHDTTFKTNCCKTCMGVFDKKREEIELKKEKNKQKKKKT